MANNEEVEIKLQIKNAAVIDNIKKYIPSLYQLGPGAVLHMSAYYYDTKELSLSRHSIVYRVRKENNKYIATIKGKDQGTDFLCRRFEINRRVNTIKPDLAIFADIEGASKVMPTVNNDMLFPIVTNNFLRQQYIIFYNSSKIELVIDLGSIYAGNKSLPICEMELELKRGIETDVIRLAEIMKTKFDLFPSKNSKLSRGLKLTKFI